MYVLLKIYFLKSDRLSNYKRWEFLLHWIMVGQPLSHTVSHAKLHQLENVRRDGSSDTIHVFVHNPCLCVDLLRAQYFFFLPDLIACRFIYADGNSGLTANTPFQAPPACDWYEKKDMEEWPSRSFSIDSRSAGSFETPGCKPLSPLLPHRWLSHHGRHLH